MMTWHDIWNWLVAKEAVFSAAASGAAGSAAISLAVWQGWTSALRHAAVGVLCSIYIPWIGLPFARAAFAVMQMVLEVPPDADKNAAGFISGITGVWIMQYFYEFAQAFRNLSKKGDAK